MENTFFEEKFRFIFIIYSFFGLSPFRLLYLKFGTNLQAYNPCKNRKKWFSFAECIWILGIITLEIYALIFASKFDMTDAMRKKFDLLAASKFVIFTIPRILHLIITLETIWKRNDHEIIHGHLHEIDEILEKHLCFRLNCHRLKQSIRNDFLRWICIIPFLILTNYHIWNVFGSIYVFLLDYSYMKLILNGSQYTTYGILVRHRIEAMHEALETNLMQALQKLEFESIFGDGQHSDDGNEPSERQCLIHLQQIYNKIYDTIELMNATFKWSMSLNISIDIFTVALVCFGHLQWFLDPTYENGTATNFYGFVTYTSYYAFRLRLVIGMCNSIAESSSSIAAKIHQITLSSNTVTDEMKDMVDFRTNK